MPLHSKFSLVIVCLILSAFSALAEDSEVFSATIDLKGPRPLVDLTINGEGPYPFVFDTGADQLFIQKSLVDELALKKIGSGRVSSPIGEGFDADRVNIGQLGLGGASILDVDAFVSTMAPQAIGTSVMGVIGPSAFKHFGRVAFDFKNKKLEIGGSIKEDGGDNWVEFGEDAPLLNADISIGDQQIPVRIDTGSPAVMAIPIQYATKIPLKGEVQTVGMARTIDREFAVKGAKVDLDIRLSDARIPMKSIKFFDGIAVGNLGMGALHGLVLEIDWQGQRYRLTGIAEPKAMRKRKRQKTQS